jgi:hypothetical protein
MKLNLKLKVNQQNGIECKKIIKIEFTTSFANPILRIFSLISQMGKQHANHQFSFKQKRIKRTKKKISLKKKIAYCPLCIRSIPQSPVQH